jgi:flagellar hook protein FlgE
MDASSIALQSLQQANAQLETAAARIASAGADSLEAAPVDVVDLSAEMVALMSAQSAFEVNLITLKAAAEMQKSLVDLKA